ncbi:unnamed protein product [Adineta steineri]|uniref:NHL repeat containing protein-like protein n=1 Tax=Adineta steineri TaxID=433720 RepID=A0A815I5A8_9BILA|nr:unnamed protein product [Adineta steineri]
MILIENFKLYLTLPIIGQLSGLSSNQPKFCPEATWNSSGTIFIANNTIKGYPDSIFITTNNSIYVVAQAIPQIYIWLNNSVNATIATTDTVPFPKTIFVQNDNELYIERGTLNKRTIEKWILNRNSSTPLDDDDTTPIIVAGTGLSGPASNNLTLPSGLFVDASLNLYVADYGNHRVQMFPPGELHGITIAGDRSINTTISLNYPTGITMDGDGYLYIVDYYKRRIVRGKSNDFRCILGCTTTNGVAANQLLGPGHMAFDRYGNIYVVDRNNQRIQKFSYEKLSCGKYQIMF